MFLAAVCPPAPLLIPGLAPRLTASRGELVCAVRTVVNALAEADHIIVIAAADTEAVLVPGTVISAHPFARSDIPIIPPRTLPGTDIDDAPVPGSGVHIAAPPATGTIVAAHLLAASGVSTPTTAVQLRAADPDLAGKLKNHLSHDPAQRTALLVMAEGAAAHGIDAPAGDDDRAEPFDRQLTAALASGDPQLLRDTCADLAPLGAELRCDSLPILAALAQVTADRARATLLHYSAPLGIGYPVALWRWDPADPASAGPIS